MTYHDGTSRDPLNLLSQITADAQLLLRLGGLRSVAFDNTIVADASLTRLLGVRLVFKDGLGQPIRGRSLSATISMAQGPPGATLSGTTSVRSDETGVVTVPDLMIDRPGTYTLVAGAEDVSAGYVTFTVSSDASTFIAVEAGLGYSCAIKTGGAAYCWGSGASGALGVGDSFTRLSPTAILGGLRFVGISAVVSTCGIDANFRAYCWGPNDVGQLGDGTTISRASPAMSLEVFHSAN